ncbi:MAG: 50S ribosomal protein L24 [Solirubrobacteraceae bacterium]
MASHPIRIRRDDTVVVVSGKDKGKTGKVLRVDRKRHKIIVEGVNMVKRHQRAEPGRPNLQVGVIEKEGGIHVSNVAIAEKDGSPSRVRIERREDGRRMRVTKKSGIELD